MYACARTYVEESHTNGTDPWTSVEDKMQFILTHPNGIQQTQIRSKACVRAGLIPDTTAGRSRIALVTEGEANLHFAVRHGGIPAQATKVSFSDLPSLLLDISRTSNTARQFFEEIAQP
jgi:hypothetical protein